MSLIRDSYRAEILGGLADAGEKVLHVFLEVDAGVLRERLMPACCLSAGRDAHAALGQAHPGRASRRGAGQGPEFQRPVRPWVTASRE
jgi:hypothetical protein